jgi:predicted DNA-binding protein
MKIKKRKGKTLSLMLDGVTVERIDAIAKLSGQTRNTVINVILAAEILKMKDVAGAK